MARELSSYDIGLYDLGKALWQDKWIVIVSITICMIVSVVYVLTAQELWTAKAMVAPPYQNQIFRYSNLFKEYQKGGLVNELADDGVSHYVFKRFIEEFNASSNKKLFLECSGEVIKDKILLEEYGGAEQLFYQDLDSGVSASPDKRSDDRAYRLKFQAKDKESAFLLLQSYTKFIDKLVEQKLVQELQRAIALKAEELAQQRQAVEIEARLKLQNEIEVTKYALSIAEKGGLKQPNLGSDGLFPVNMGSNALGEKLDILKKIKKLSFIEPRLYALDAILSVIANTQQQLSIQILPYRYLKEPSQPISRDKPKKALIVVLGMLLGGMVGVTVVLFKVKFLNEGVEP